MHTYSLAAAFLSAVTASPLQDFSPFEFVLPSSGQPNNAPIPFQDFFAQTNTNLDSYNLEQPQILAQSPSTSPDIYEFVKPQILTENPDQRMVETVRGDSPGGNDPLPLPSTANYLPSDLKFQQAPCDTTSSVCCQRAYNGESSQSVTCAAKEIIKFAGSDHTSMTDSTSAKFGRYCLAPVYFSDCNQMWPLVWGTTGYDCYTECERVPLDRGHPATWRPSR